MLYRETNEMYVVAQAEHWLYAREPALNTFYKMVNSMQANYVSDMYYELEMLKLLQSHYTLTPLQIEQRELKHCLFFETEDGVSLQDYLAKPLSLLSFLNIALEMTNAFIDLQHSSIVYRNVHPSNFLINEKNNTVKLLNFEYAYKIYGERATKKQGEPKLLYRSHYFAPEETGRVSETIDCRTDLYSLGVVFYEMLAQVVPFPAQEERTLFHEIMTKKPKPIHELKPMIPLVISEIVDKLLQKNKTARYQSATGLKEDLLFCLNQLVNHEELKPFPLGRQDSVAFHQLSKVIPSRQPIVTMIQQLFQQTNERTSVAVLLKGDVGIGKTELLDELKNHWTQQGIRQLEVKSKSVYRELSPIVSAIREQLKQLYKEGATRIDEMRALFEHRNVIFYDEVFQLLPELEWFVSEELRQSVVTGKHYPADLQLLFHQLLKDILLIVVKENEPLVIVVEQIEQLDRSSLQCLFMMYRELPCVYFIFTYQQANEQLDVVQQTIHFDLHMQLEPLSLSETQQWLEHSLKEQTEDIARLGSLLYDLTKGNPLFIRELFQTFRQMELLYYSRQQLGWKMDLEKMTDLAISDNLLDFFASRVAELTIAQQTILRHAACIGLDFGLSKLAWALGQEQHALLPSLQALI